MENIPFDDESLIADPREACSAGVRNSRTFYRNEPFYSRFAREIVKSPTQNDDGEMTAEFGCASPFSKTVPTFFDSNVIHTLDLSGMPYSSSEIIGKCLKSSSSSLQHLNISNNPIDINFVLRVLTFCPRLERLDAAHCKIRGERLCGLSHAHLRYLNLSSNKFSGILRMVYVRMPLLDTLDLSDNSVTKVQIGDGCDLPLLRNIHGLVSPIRTLVAPEANHNLSRMANHDNRPKIITHQNVPDLTIGIPRDSESIIDDPLVSMFLRSGDSHLEMKELDPNAEEYAYLSDLLIASSSDQGMGLLALEEAVKLQDLNGNAMMLNFVNRNESVMFLYYCPINVPVESILSSCMNGECPLVLSLNIPTWSTCEIFVFLVAPGRTLTYDEAEPYIDPAKLRRYQSIFFPNDACFTILDSDRILPAYICKFSYK